MANKRLCICPECGKQFEGWPNSIYCHECATERYKERQRGYNQRRRAKEAEKKKTAPKPVVKKPDTKQCKGCKHWRYLWSGGKEKSSLSVCHYMLDTEKRREHDGDICYSRTPKETT